MKGYWLIVALQIATIVVHASPSYSVTDTSAYRSAFDLVDLNVDGLFEEQEFIKFRDMMEASKRGRLNELFVAFDSNNDRALTRSEFDLGLDQNEEFLASLRPELLTDSRVARMKEAMDRRALALGQPVQAVPTVAMLGGKCNMQVSQTPLDHLVLGTTVLFEVSVTSSGSATCKNVVLSLVLSKSVHYVHSSVVFVDPFKGNQNDNVNSDQTLYIPSISPNTHGFIFAIGTLAQGKRQVIQMRLKLCGDPGTTYYSLLTGLKDFLVIVDLHSETRHSPQYAKCFDDCAQQHGGCDFPHSTCTPCTSPDLTRSQRQAFCVGDQGVVCSPCPFDKGDGKHCHNHAELCGAGMPCYPSSLACHQGRCIINVCLEGFCSPYATCTPQSDTTATCACNAGYHGTGVGGNGCVPN